ncbi:MAG: hypothetical protein AAFV33_29485, partial [Chloroflexota bacterium]
MVRYHHSVRLLLAVLLVMIGGLAIETAMPQMASAQGACNGAQFVDDNGIIVMEIEDQPPAGDWRSRTNVNGFTGTAYYQWRGSNQFGNPGSGLMNYRIKINTPGEYRFIMH